MYHGPQITLYGTGSGWMDRSNSPVSIDSLITQARGYRRQVNHEPLDMRARANLAWCLFLQAMHESGREHLLSALRERGAMAEMPSDGAFRLSGDARQLLRECLTQMRAVYELSHDPLDRADVERLRELVSISGAEAALCDADAEAARWLAEMAQAILTAPPVERRHRYRRVPRVS
jgi:hypothetical protein